MGRPEEQDLRTSWNRMTFRSKASHEVQHVAPGHKYRKPHFFWSSGAVWFGNLASAMEPHVPSLSKLVAPGTSRTDPSAYWETQSRLLRSTSCPMKHRLNPPGQPLNLFFQCPYRESSAANDGRLFYWDEDFGSMRPSIGCRCQASLCGSTVVELGSSRIKSQDLQSTPKVCRPFRTTSASASAVSMSTGTSAISRRWKSRPTISFSFAWLRLRHAAHSTRQLHVSKAGKPIAQCRTWQGQEKSRLVKAP